MIKYNLKYFKELNSTNTYAMQNIATLFDGDIIVASKQTMGKGRFQRKWISDKENNCYLSIVLKPASTVNNNLPMVNITQYTSVVLCKVLEKYGIKSEIKWPNDVLVNNQKIAGILSEASICGQEFKGLVLGVGVNLNLKEAEVNSIDQPATSLNLITGKQVDSGEFIQKVAEEFFKNYEIFLCEGFDFIKNEYARRCSFIGKEIIIKNLSSQTTGIALQINDDGSLLIEDLNSNKLSVIIGDITYIKQDFDKVPQ